MGDVNNNNSGRLLLALGVCTISGAWLFDVSGLGLNIVIFSLLLGIAFKFVHQTGRPGLVDSISLLLAFLFVVSFMWRESTILLWANGFALLSLLLINVSKHDSETSGLFLVDFFSAGDKAAHKLINSAVKVAKEDVVLVVQRSRVRRKFGAILRGLLISIPFVIIAGSLLVSADIKFSNFVDNLFSVDLDFPDYLAPMFICLFLAAAFLTNSEKRKSLGWYEALDRSWYLGETEIITILISINSVFALYIYVQIGHYFGNDTMIRNTHGFIYSQYARDGFFQLLTLSIVTLAFLWGLEWFNRKEKRVTGRWFKLMSVTMISLLCIIEASAMHRMILYTNAYGITESRFYATALMIWIAGVFIIFVMTVLNGRPQKFMGRSLYCGMILVLALNILNPASWIARYNINQASTVQLDVQYLSQLGSDAYPAIFANIKSVPESKQCFLLKVARHKLKLAIDDIRVWSWSTYKAKQSVNKVNVKCL